jgi:DNA polymerase-3 subunit epsilon
MLELKRPLAVFDIEATGLNSRADRIVEISIVKLMPDESQKIHTWRVNPLIPIPPEVTEIHGITDEDVADCPTFDDIAPAVHDILEGCDLGGYNILHFDIPLLLEEFMRARIIFKLDDRRMVDAQRIFHKKEPRDLKAALQFFCNETLTNAHGAEADAVATLQVIKGQLEKYEDLPHDVDGLDSFCNPRDPDWADRTGRLKTIRGDVAVNFGKMKGSLLKDLATKDPNYLRWIIRSDFPRDTQEIVRRFIEEAR